MSYRDDHDAALMRVAALETEIAQLRKAKGDSPAPFAPRKSKLPAVAVTLATASGLAALMTVMHFGAAAEAAAPTAPVAEEEAAPAPAQVGLPALRACLQAIEPINDSLDATTTDPRGVGIPVASIVRTGASCRTELGHVLEGSNLSATQRDRLSTWYATENALANTISMIGVYYGSNPVALDNYATAPQLWTEYHRAGRARDAAIDGLTSAL